MTFVVTGVALGGKRFRIRTENQMHAFGINLWRGSVWAEENGKRRLLRRVWN